MKEEEKNSDVWICCLLFFLSYNYVSLIMCSFLSTKGDWEIPQQAFFFLKLVWPAFSTWSHLLEMMLVISSNVTSHMDRKLFGECLLELMFAEPLQPVSQKSRVSWLDQLHRWHYCAPHQWITQYYWLWHNRRRILFISYLRKCDWLIFCWRFQLTFFFLFF